ncbi:MAG: ABC transporter permease [Roseivirga sp.]
MRARPPAWAQSFLKAYCRDEFREEIEGDVYELFENRVERLGVKRARLLFIWDVLRFFRWSNIKKTTRFNSNNIAMLKNYFLIANRNMWREKTYSFLNITGLYVGFLCLILTVVYLNRQCGYDSHHAHAQDTYRFLLVDDENANRSASSAGPWAPKMAQDFPEIADYVRIGGFSTSIFRYKGQHFYETGGILADPSILSVFSYDFKWGDPGTALDEPFNMVISEAMASKYFGDANPVGEVFEVNQGEQYKITGVLSGEQQPTHINFEFVASFDSHQDDFRYDWVIQNYITYIQLKSEADVAGLETKLVDFFKRNTPETGVSIDGRTYALEPVKDIYLYSNVNDRVPTIKRVTTFALIGLFILLIALVNYVNLVTARSTQRLKEVGVRKAIGARRQQLALQFLTESFYFCLLAFVAAVFSVNLFMPAYSELVNETLTFSLTADYQLVLVLLAVTVLVGALSGLYPAAVLSTIKPTNLMSQHGSKFGGRNAFRKALTGLQFFISIALIIATAMVNRQLDFMSEKDLGFDKEHIMVVALNNTSILENKESFADRLEQSPYVTSVGLSGQAIGGGDWGMPFRYEGGDEPQPSRFMAVDAAFGKTLGLEFLAGRNFSEELTTDVDNSYIINETFMKRVGWTSPQEAVGKGIEMPARNADGTNSWTPGTVVGVVKDFHYRDLRTNMLPLVISNRIRWTDILFVKLQANAVTEGLNFVSDQWKEAEGQTPFNYYFLDDRLERFYEPEARLSKTASIYGAIAIILACFGLFSLSTFMAEQRMKEVSVRKVLGASMQQIFLMFSKPFVSIVVIAALAAIPAALYLLSDWLNEFAYSLSIGKQLDIPILAALITLFVALLTVAYQSLRLSRANPVRFLRNE